MNVYIKFGTTERATNALLPKKFSEGSDGNGSYSCGFETNKVIPRGQGTLMRTGGKVVQNDVIDNTFLHCPHSYIIYYNIFFFTIWG